MGLSKTDFIYKANREYLQGGIDCDISFVDVKNELCAIEQKCKSLEIPFLRIVCLLLTISLTLALRIDC